MPAFHSQTPEALLKEVAEYLRLRGLQLGIEAHPVFKAKQARKTAAAAKEYALNQVAQELENATLQPPFTLNEFDRLCSASNPPGGTHGI